jgi:LemA protein
VGGARARRGAPLSTWAIVGLAVGALLLFWVLGAYNRLIELRNAAADAWAQADAALRQRGEAVDALVNALREPLAAEAVALEALQTAHEHITHASAAMSARPLHAASANAWVDAESRLGAAAARVFALLENAGDVAALDPVSAAVAMWSEGAQRLPYTRQLFNDAAARYDEATREFPTSLLVRMIGFAPAGRV